MTSAAQRRPWPLVVRRARADDQAAVLAFATNTWEGWDYMPHAFPRWLDASDGVMLVGLVGAQADGGEQIDADGAPLEPGTVVAVVRIAVPAATEAWLEGIRVDPRVRGMDVATDLQVAELHWAAANGACIVRYATSARNEGSHRLGARGGFEQVVELFGTSWQPPRANDADHTDHAESGFIEQVQAQAQTRREALLRALGDQGVVAAERDAGALWQLVSDDATFNAAGRLYEPRPWALEELTHGKFTEHVQRGEVVVESGADGSAAAVAILVAIVPAAEEAMPRLAELAGAPRAAFQLIERIRKLADEPIRIRYPSGAPLVDDARELYESAGYEFSEWALHILARPIDATHPVPPIDPTALILDEEPEPSAIPAR